MKYYSTLKRKNILKHAMTWMVLEVIVLNEISQSQKDTHCCPGWWLGCSVILCAKMLQVRSQVGAHIRLRVFHHRGTCRVEGQPINVSLSLSPPSSPSKINYIYI